VSKEWLVGIGEITRHLQHPLLVRMRCDARDLHCAASQIKKEQNIVGYQAAQGKDFDREEVSGRDTLPVRLEEGRPRRAFPPFRRGIDTLFAQYIRDRPAPNVMS
jgi:hypothetical protein